MNITIRELKSMIMNFEGVNPKISENTYISESVDIIGNVVIEENANIWFGSRLRADMNQIYHNLNYRKSSSSPPKSAPSTSTASNSSSSAGRPPPKDSPSFTNCRPASWALIRLPHWLSCAQTSMMALT